MAAVLMVTAEEKEEPVADVPVPVWFIEALPRSGVLAGGARVQAAKEEMTGLMVGLQVHVDSDWIAAIGGGDDDADDDASPERLRSFSYTRCCSEALHASTSLQRQGDGAEELRVG